jgi:hypothetical protein
MPGSQGQPTQKPYRLAPLRRKATPKRAPRLSKISLSVAPPLLRSEFFCML